MYKVKTFNKVAEIGLRDFDANKYNISDSQDNPDVILVRSAPLHDEKFGDNLKVVTRIGAGVNTIPIDRLTEMGVCVFNCPGGNANAVKEMTLAAMIAEMRNMAPAMKWVKELSDEDIAAGGAVESGKEKFRGPEIIGKTIGIIGAGAIGSLMMRSCFALGMKVLAYDPMLGHAKMQDLAQYGKFVTDLDEILTQADVITVHVPLNDKTKGMIGANEIAKMKDGAYLINYARGPILDNDAVCDALDSGKLAGFATDFPTSRQAKRDDIIVTPHLASGSPEAENNCSIMAARQTIDYVENGNITNSVNFPDVSFARAEGARICVIHENKVGMLGKMTDSVVTHGLNIENLVNKAKGKIAYTIMDFNEEVPASLADVIEKIDGVIRVRVIE